MARIAPGLATRSRVAKIPVFTAMSSKAASTTMSASPARSSPIAPPISPRRSASASALKLPRARDAA
ncbi:hypothetical protein AEGHOMDF_4957 [Methylobacterium soli]|nr:hypothetical protein AEGHOMDF_4957 [Methylobacterium soli]